MPHERSNPVGSAQLARIEHQPSAGRRSGNLSRCSGRLSTLGVLVTCDAVDTFDAWYVRQHPRVLGVVFVACGDGDVAADATDEAFARALAGWDRVSQMDSPEGWTCRVAINVMRRRLRRRRLEYVVLRRRHPPDQVEQAVAYPELWSAVRELPERQRLAILLRYVADLTEADVAKVMGVTRGAVSASLTTARGRLATVLNESGDTQGAEVPNG